MTFRTFTFSVTLAFALSLGACASAKKNGDSANGAPTPAASASPAPAKTRAHKKKPSNTSVAAVEAGKQEEAPAGAKSAGAQSVTCKNGGDERKLDIVAANGGCKLNYQKEGASSAIASQQEGDAKCHEVLDRVVKKLSDAGYDCK